MVPRFAVSRLICKLYLFAHIFRVGKDNGFCAEVKRFFPIFAATKNHKPVKNVMRTISIRIVFILLILPSVLFAQYEPQKMRKNEIKVALLSLVSGTSKVT